MTATGLHATTHDNTLPAKPKMADLIPLLLLS